MGPGLGPVARVTVRVEVGARARARDRASG